MRDWTKVLVGFAIGLIISYFHWVGLIVGGLAVGIASRNLRTALAAGLAFGIMVWLAFIAMLSVNGMAGKFFAMSPLSYLSLLLTVVATTISASITNFFSRPVSSKT